MGSGIFSIEMTREQLELRLLCAQAGVEWEKVERGTLTDAEWLLFTNAAAKFSKAAQIYIDDTPSLTTRQLLVESRRLVDKHGVALIVVDYLQIMGADRRYENQNVQYEDMSQQFLSISKQVGVPLIVLSQLTKNTTNTPLIKMRCQQRLDMLRGSGGIGQAASRVMFVYYDETESAWLQDKTRTGTGRTGSIPMVFEGGCWDVAELNKNPDDYGPLPI